METAELVLSNLIVVQVLHLASIPVQPDSLGEGGIEGFPHTESLTGAPTTCFRLCI